MFWRRRSAGWVAGWLGLLVAGTPALACPFCTMQGRTLTGEVEQASMVLFGTLANANAEKETTDLRIEAVVKDHDIRGQKKVLTIPRYVPIPGAGDVKQLVFFEVFKNKLDPYRGIVVKKDSSMAKYLQGAMKVQNAPLAKRLRFFFDYLDDPDIEVSNDAYKEFGNVGYRDYSGMARDLPADRVVGWLKDKDTPNFRIGLYASMLGHCGKEEHARFLRELLDNSDRRLSSGIDGVLAGYTMLKPREGWEYIRGILTDPSKEFLSRYAALRTVRFLWEYRPDLVTRTKLVDAIVLLLEQGDIADLAIEDLRKWKQWDRTEQVLALVGKKEFEVPVVSRAILRFALSSPEKAAKEYVARKRKEDPRAVADAEELLKLEAEDTKGSN